LHIGVDESATSGANLPENSEKTTASPDGSVAFEGFNGYLFVHCV
jgi:hypothetical protein